MSCRAVEQIFHGSGSMPGRMLTLRVERGEHRLLQPRDHFRRRSVGPSQPAEARRAYRNRPYDGAMGAERQVGVSALQFLPARISMTSLREAARDCQGCPLYKNATQTVFGQGRKSARILLVGEQPGNEEDLQGAPFVGPAGRLLDEALEEAGIVRADAYLTNVVKHFKWTPKGKRRMHKKPGAREIAACLPWLEKEIELIKPEVLVCLGATAAQSLLGRSFKVSLQRGQVLPTSFARHTLATVHPSSILRQQTGEERRREMARFTADLRVAARLLNTSHPRH
jgi:uracil-DNA glycosylase